MCGRFTQYNTREEYLAFLGEEAERDIPYDPQSVGRYNVAPGTRVLLLSERSSQLKLDPVHWGYAPEWWHKPALINARSETAAGSRMFRPLWEHGRAIGDSMKDMGLHSGDLMVVDKAEKPMQGDIVIAETDGEFTVKRLQIKPRIALLPMNAAYPTLYPEELQIFGVVMAFIHKTRSTN
ncbi:hypothetical protein DAI21_22540 (plasmid) [Lelliottia sp. WB101]|nr:hypothetical protein DAI21_22540 [Lelliottia sp. WB101]